MPALRERARRGAPIVVATALALALSGCGAGKHPATLDDAPLNVQSANVGEIAVRGAIVVAPEDGSSGAVFVATFINGGSTPDALTGVTITTPDGDVGGTLRPASIALAPNATTRIPEDERPMVTIDHSLDVGSYVTARLAFGEAGSGTMTLLVVAPTGPYAEYAPA